MKIFEIFWNSKIDKVDKIFGRPVNLATIVHRPDLKAIDQNWICETNTELLQSLISTPRWFGQFQILQ